MRRMWLRREIVVAGLPSLVKVVGDYIDKIKTTFNLFQALNSMDTENIELERSCLLKSFSLIACKLIIRKKLVSNLNLNKR